MRDWRGTEIEVGDTIVYVVKESTTTPMHEAIVTELYKRNDLYFWSRLISVAKAEWINSSRGSLRRTIKTVHLTRPENIVVLRKARASEIPECRIDTCPNCGIPSNLLRKNCPVCMGSKTQIQILLLQPKGFPIAGPQ